MTTMKTVNDKSISDLYLVRVIGGVEPAVIGPYKSEKERDNYAVEIKKEIVTAGDLDGLFMLDVTPGYKPRMAEYSNGFFWDRGVE